MTRYILRVETELDVADDVEARGHAQSLLERDMPSLQAPFNVKLQRIHIAKVPTRVPIQHPRRHVNIGRGRP